MSWPLVIYILCSNSFVRFRLQFRSPSVLFGLASLLTSKVGFLRQVTLTLTVCVLLHMTFSMRRSGTYSLRVALT
jgi:hypothetical protein